MAAVELHLDFESRSRTSLPDRGLDNYCADPSTEILMLAFAVNEALPEVWFPADGPMPEHLELMIRRPEILKVAFQCGVRAHNSPTNFGYCDTRERLGQIP